MNNSYIDPDPNDLEYRAKLRRKARKKEFIEECKNKFGRFYDYSHVKWITCADKVTIICPIHGPFDTRPCNFVREKVGCPKCWKEFRTFKRAMEYATKVFMDDEDPI